MDKVKIHKSYSGNDIFLCIKKKGACPFCEAYKVLRETGLTSDKELSKKYKPVKIDKFSTLKLGYMPYDYLEIIVKGGTPTWCEDAKIWVTKYEE